jgi:intraflagellar transport protein 81
LEQEKDQLNTRINMFKTKNSSKPEFKTLLEATNLLRREQEEEARLAEKYRTQRQQLEWTDQQLLSAQQRLIDAKKSLSVDNTAEQMLQGLRLEVKKNRDLCNERLAIEIMEKRKKLDQVEHMLAEPPVSASEISKLESGIVTLRRTVQQLEEKLKTETNPDEDKLAIYKQQANLVAKKKEQKLDELKKTEEEKERLEKKIKDKEAELEKLKGPGYRSKDSFKDYAAKLREKTNKFKKLKDELREIKNEIGILTRTEQIVRSNKEDHERELRRKESERGVAGASNTKEGLGKVSEKKHEVDVQKGKTLEEISKIVQQLEAKFKEKKETLRPKMNELKDLREKFKTLEKTYSVKKAEYDQTIAGVESENAGLESEVKKIKVIVKEII